MTNSKKTFMYMLFAGWEVRIMITVTEVLIMLSAAFSSPRSQSFTIRNVVVWFRNFVIVPLPNKKGSVSDKYVFVIM